MNTWTIVSTLVALLVAPSPDAPQWADDYAVALAVTKRTQRPLLIVIEDPRRADLRLEKVSTHADKAQAALLSDFQLCRIDAATQYGRQAAESFNVRQYPYAAIIDRTGSVILHQQSGPIATDQWVATLTRYRSGVYVAQREVVRARCVT